MELGGPNALNMLSEGSSTDEQREALVERAINAATSGVTVREKPKTTEHEETDDDMMDDDSDDGEGAEYEDARQSTGVDCEVEEEAGPPPKEVDAASHADTASTMTGAFYSEAFARQILKTSCVMYQQMIHRYVVHEVFKDMKFTLGDDAEEMGLAELAIEEEYVKIDDAKISNSAFVNEFYPCISKEVTLLRTRSQNNARKKFQRKFECVVGS